MTTIHQNLRETDLQTYYCILDIACMKIGNTFVIYYHVRAPDKSGYLG